MPLRKTRITKADGRYLWYYTWDGPPPEIDVPTGGLSMETEGLELRWHPLLETWVVVAPERQERTFLPPPEYCPLCPTRDPSSLTEVPSSGYEIVVFENRFPSFRRDAPQPAQPPAPHRAGPAAGAGEVVVYSSDHDATLGALPAAQIERLVEVWTDRYRELAARPEVAYVFIFENRGEEIGVTLTHPHGQIYAFPFVPPHVERELTAARRYQREHGGCLHCALIEDETASGERLVAHNESFVAFVPYFARWPYELHVVSRRHRASLAELTKAERRDLAGLLKVVLQKYDNLWGFPMPFVMSIHQRPTDGRRYPGCHLHIEFTPPYRSRDRLKYLAGCETGAGTFIVDARAEETAVELRWAAPKT
ncbi:MAG: galactose-1-phosphate uridylyltransferase [Dehalococcoidia bacterium]